MTSTVIGLPIVITDSSIREVFMQVRAICVLSNTGSEHARAMSLSCSTHDVVIVGSTPNVNEVPALIQAARPDLIFYDPALDGGETLVTWQAYVDMMPVLVCWTCDPSYAVLAFEAGAVHYLMDRCSPEDLDLAVYRCSRRMAQRSRAMLIAERGPEAPYQTNVIALPVNTGFEVRNSDQIVHVHGEGNYARVVFERDPELLLSRTVGDIEHVLQHAGFLRVHRSALVNLRHVRKLIRGKGSRVEMSNGDHVDVSDRYREHLISELNVVRRL